MGERDTEPRPHPLPLPPPADDEEPADPRRSSLPHVETLVWASRDARDGDEREPTNPGGVPSGRHGQVIAGRYLVEQELGEGSMGKIFRVRHLQLGRPFALKLIQMALHGATEIRDRFYVEARLASQLVHPNVVSVVDFGEDAEHGAFMVMELLDGEPLAQRLSREGRFPLRLACEMVMQIAEALHYVHGQHVVHGDIKPDNVFCCTLPSTERRRLQVKLLDFGIARVLESQKTSTIEGTPAYLAPERIRGEGPQPAVDIYSLGVVFFEMLTGQLPFRGGIMEILTAHTLEPPPRPSDVAGAEIDERAEALILRALAKEPADRHRDMAAFIYELRTLMEMHGLRRRERQHTIRGAAVASGAKDRRELGQVLGYEVAPLPMAALDADGTIVVHNRAFARFVTGDAAAALEGSSVLATSLAQLCPELEARLGEAARDGVLFRTKLDVPVGAGSAVRIALHLVPGNEEGGPVQLYVHALM